MHLVAIVLNPDFGEKLLTCALNAHVWAVDSPENRKYAKKVWKNEFATQFTITVFVYDPNNPPEDECIYILEAVDEHKYDFPDEWGAVEVYGVKLTEKVEEAFRKYGFTDFNITKQGFSAKRKTEK